MDNTSMDNATLLNIQKQLGDLATTMATSLGEIKADIKALKANADNDYHALYGNKDPGLVQKVEVIGSRTSTIEKKVCEIDCRVTAIETHGKAVTYGIRLGFTILGWFLGVASQIFIAWIQTH